MDKKSGFLTNMSLTQFAINKTRITFTFLALVIIAGIMTFKSMPRAEDPGFTIRTATVVTYFPGASSERVELLLTDKLEKIIKEMPELDYVSSTSKTGMSIVYVNIKESYKKLRPIWDSLRRKVEKAEPSLPSSIVGPFVNDEFGEVFGTILSIVGDGFSYKYLKEVADEVRDELLMIEDVAKVNIIGAQEERIFIEFNNALLSKLGLSPIKLKQILESQNIILPGGNIVIGKERLILEPSGSFDSIEAIKKSVIKLPRQRVIYLKDIASVYHGYIDPPDSSLYSSGAPALGLAISMRDGGNIITLGEEVKKLINKLKNSYPVGVEFEIISFQPKNVETKVNDFISNLFQSITIVILIMLIFLGLRTGLIVASLVPSAMIATLMFMGIFNIGLDQVSLAALIISLGILVDNAIVMAESIMVQISEGKPTMDACIDSANELKIPLLTSSLTTAAAFLPIFLAESSVGEYTSPLFKVVAITLLCSWFIAITLIPLLCFLFLKIKNKKEQQKENTYNTPFYNWYRNIIKNSLQHPYITIASVFIIFFISLYGFRFVPKIFFPPSDKAIITAELNFPIGTPIEQTTKASIEIDKYIKQNLLAKKDTEGIINWASFIGEGAPRFIVAYSPEPRSPEYMMLIINTTTDKVIPEVISKLENFCTINFPDLETKISKLQMGIPVDYPVEVRISGKDNKKLFKIANQIKIKLAKHPGIKTVGDNWGLRSKKIAVEIDQARALQAGITNQDIAISLQTVLSGIEVTQYRKEDKIIPIVLRATSSDREDFNKLENLKVYSQSTGRSVPLKQVADIKIKWQISEILRRNQLRTITIQCSLNDNYTASTIIKSINPWLSEMKDTWPTGYTYEFGGEKETSGDANKSIMDQLPIAGLFIILLLISQFNSVRKTLIIILTIPLGIIGVVIGLLLMRSSFGFMALLGVVSLSGIIINNAIVLLERIKLEIDVNKLTPQQAIITSAQKRLRPILLTTMTTIAGLIPLWLGGGPMWESMAITIIFGLMFATVLTLGFVPVMYSILFPN